MEACKALIKSIWRRWGRRRPQQGTRRTWPISNARVPRNGRYGRNARHARNGRHGRNAWNDARNGRTRRWLRRRVGRQLGRHTARWIIVPRKEEVVIEASLEVSLKARLDTMMFQYGDNYISMKPQLIFLRLQPHLLLIRNLITQFIKFISYPLHLQSCEIIILLESKCCFW